MKYFNFLLENDINFSRDEAGNYVALVKVLNPAFYGGGAPQDQKTQQNQQLPTNSNLESKRKIQDSKRMESKGNTETEPFMEGKPRSSSQANRYNQSGFSGSYGGTGGSNARGQNSSVKKLKNVKNNHFEKEKKAVSYKYIIYYSIGCKEKLSGNIRRKISEVPAKCKSTIRSKRKENESSCFEICN